MLSVEIFFVHGEKAQEKGEISIVDGLDARSSVIDELPIHVKEAVVRVNICVDLINIDRSDGCR